MFYGERHRGKDRDRQADTGKQRQIERDGECKITVLTPSQPRKSYHGVERQTERGRRMSGGGGGVAQSSHMRLIK